MHEKLLQPILCKNCEKDSLVPQLTAFHGIFASHSHLSHFYKCMHSKKKGASKHLFCCFRLSQIEDFIQYLEGPNSTWKDHDRNIGVTLLRFDDQERQNWAFTSTLLSQMCCHKHGWNCIVFSHKQFREEIVVVLENVTVLSFITCNNTIQYHKE